MPKLLSRIQLAFQAGRELGWKSSAWYALYQLGLRTGHYRRESLKRQQAGELPSSAYRLAGVLDLPGRDELLKAMGEAGKARLIDEAEEIINGQVRLFGAVQAPLDFDENPTLRHWTEGDTSAKIGDVKLIWEPARFGWMFTLARAYAVTSDENCPEMFWRQFETFERANPPEMGIHWESAQEVALRLIAYVFAAQAFEHSIYTTPAHLKQIARAVEAHARRIPSTLAYARAQGNNHLLTEAAGLYTAGCALPEHPEARQWRDLGLRTFEGGVIEQFTPQGEYSQHSTNYQRLALQIGLWMSAVTGRQGDRLDPMVIQRLAAGTRWLLRLADAGGGRTPNLGPNDGAYIFPFASLPQLDFRPTLQAAACWYLGAPAFTPGEWDEMGLWLAGETVEGQAKQAQSVEACDLPLRLESRHHRSWVYFRTAEFKTRPGHADQLHVDLWMDGLNLAIDPGSYLYNAQAPWNNALAEAGVHNTITVDGRDQMLRAGKFLWLHWAQARVIDCRQEDSRVVMVEVEHNGFRRLGLTHRRRVIEIVEGWRVEDQITAAGGGGEGKLHTARLHWLMPDLPWRVDVEEETGDIRLELETDTGPVELRISGQGQMSGWGLAWAGERLAGSLEARIIDGWTSPTYAVKIPALSLSVEISGRVPIKFTSVWKLPAQQED